MGCFSILFIILGPNLSELFSPMFLEGSHFFRPVQTGRTSQVCALSGTLQNRACFYAASSHHNSRAHIHLVYGTHIPGDASFAPWPAQSRLLGHPFNRDQQVPRPERTLLYSHTGGAQRRKKRGKKGEERKKEGERDTEGM